MRIKENNFEGNELYSPEMQERVKKVLQVTFQILETRRLLAEIKKDSAGLRNLFLTEEEMRQRQDAVNFFDARLQSMAYYTIKYLEKYQQIGWRELIYEGEDRDGTTDSI